MKRRLTCLFLWVLICVPFIQAQSAQPETTRRILTAEQWREDLRFMVKMIETVHPNPFGRVSRERFEHEVNQLNSAIPHLPGEKIVVGMMQIVALLDDGHTNLTPYDPNGFNHWFPDSILFV